MKKIVIALALAAALAGCSKEKNSDPTVSKLEVKMNIEAISEDILNYYDIEFNYVDFDGKESNNTVTAPANFEFSIANPELSEDDSTPFTVELKLTRKGTAAKAEGNYDATFKWQLDVNQYDQNGSLITDTGCVQMRASTEKYSFDNFDRAVQKLGLTKITYYSFFCKTISGVWHGGVSGREN